MLPTSASLVAPGLFGDSILIFAVVVFWIIAGITLRLVPDQVGYLGLMNWTRSKEGWPWSVLLAIVAHLLIMVLWLFHGVSPWLFLVPGATWVTMWLVHGAIEVNSLGEGVSECGMGNEYD